MPRTGPIPSTVAALALILAAAPALAGDGAEPADRFAEETAVVLVEVPVQVLRKGEPVRGLTAEDFVVLDEGREREIVGFQVIDIADTGETALRAVDGGRTAEPALPLAARRSFLLLFDLSYSQPTMVERARRAAEKLVADALHPSDLVAVAIFTASQGARLTLGFTADRQQLAEALANLSGPQPYRHFRDPLALVVGDLFDPGHPYRGGGGGGDNKSIRYDVMLQYYRDLQESQARSQRQRREADVLGIAASLEDLGRLLRGVGGRKHVVMLSEGFDSSVLVGTMDSERISAMAEDSAQGQLWRVDSTERFGSPIVRQALDRALEEFRRSDALIHTVDIGGVRVDDGLGHAGAGQEGLFLIADQTGGEFYREYNDLQVAMGEVLERTRVTYLLAVQPDDLPFDGSYRRLKVRLADRVPGAKVTHRPGYFAPRPFGETSDVERRVSAAGLLVGGRDGGPLDLSVLAAPIPLPEGGAWVPVVAEVAGPSLLRDSPSAALPLELYAYALSPDGTVRDFFSQLVNFDLDKVGEAMEGGGFKFWGRFDLEPGAHVLRVLVRNAVTGSVGLRSLALTVPAFVDGEAALLPPLVPDPPGRWLIARQESAAPDPPYPFLLDGQAFVPAARPSVAAGQTLRLALLGYNLAPQDVTARGRLLTPDGAVAAESELALDPQAAGGGETRFATRLAAAVPPGDYLLEVTLTGDDGAGATALPLPLRVQ